MTPNPTMPPSPTVPPHSHNDPYPTVTPSPTVTPPQPPSAPHLQGGAERDPLEDLLLVLIEDPIDLPHGGQVELIWGEGKGGD